MCNTLYGNFKDENDYESVICEWFNGEIFQFIHHNCVVDNTYDEIKESNAKNSFHNWFRTIKMI